MTLVSSFVSKIRQTYMTLAGCLAEAAFGGCCHLSAILFLFIPLFDRHEACAEMFICQQFLCLLHSNLRAVNAQKVRRSRVALLQKRHGIEVL